MPRVMRRPLAETDILQIWDYIADDSLAAADRWVDRIDEQFSLLAAQPLIGRSREELAPGMRSFPVGRYVIFYGMLARHFGFTEEKLDFIINYDIKYRMGRDTKDENA